MEVKEAGRHPDADSLWVYKMTAPGFGEVQIVANSQNIYSVGAKAIVVLAGATLKDGTVIRDSKLRGVSSYGMALGHADVEVGTDLTEEYCRDTSTNGFHFLSWPSIESLFNVRRSMKQTNTERKVTYSAKIKLDGTNAGVQVSTDARVAAQSRTGIVTPEKDNHGFARWVEDNKERFEVLAGGKHITVFGEWCGPGVQKNVAICKIPHKIFAVFAIQYGGVDGQPARFDINPATITTRIESLLDGGDVLVLPWENMVKEFDFTDSDKLRVQADWAGEAISKLEQCDPWVKRTFGVEGVGEGLVFYPILDPPENIEAWDKPMMIDALEYSELVFKVKGEKHKTIKTKQVVPIDPEVAKNISEFVDLFVTDARLNQFSVDLGFDPKNTGTFIKNFTQDVHKESEAELEVSGLNWKQVSKDVSNAARNWFLAKCNQI